MIELEKIIKIKIKDNISLSFIEFAYKYILDIDNKIRFERKKGIISVVKNYDKYANDDFSWDKLCNISNEIDVCTLHTLYSYMIYLLENGLYKGVGREYILENIEDFYLTRGSNIKKMIYKGSRPEFFYLTKINNSTINKSRFNLNTTNNELKKILIKFIEEELSSKEKVMTRFKVFIYHFSRSIKHYSIDFKSIYDFNYSLFSKQYKYYKKINFDDHKATTILNRFYIFLLKYIDKNDIKHTIFTTEDKIDLNYLRRGNFSVLYENGFRLVFLNPFDSIPNEDRWLVVPNGAEKKTISRKHYEYSPIDFSLVKSKLFKNALKSWYWNSDKSIYTRDKSYYLIVKFIIFLLDLHNKKNKSNVFFIRDKSIPDRNYNVTTNDIINYKAYIRNKYDNSYSRNSSIASIKEFLSYCKIEGLLDIEITAFDYLRGFTKDEIKPNPIKKEDLDLIVGKYKQLYNSGNLIEKEMFYIIYLCLTTSLRINEVLKLERKCLVENMKKNQFSIRYSIDDLDDIELKSTLNLLRKNGKGEYKEKNIDKYTEKIIRQAIKDTEHLRELTEKDTSKYIFLYKGIQNSIKVISIGMVQNNFKKVISELPLSTKDYTLYNLRDTFMSNIYDIGKKNNLSIEEIHMATDHKDISTTIKHYRNSDIKSYLEAFYGIKLGNIEIRGGVAYNLDNVIKDVKDVKEIIVSDSCGYCKKKGCGDSYNIDCLICKNFITTIDRIPFFDNRIKNLDYQIENETIEHEKEHLLKIKEVLVGYVEKLYLLKQRS